MNRLLNKTKTAPPRKTLVSVASALLMVMLIASPLLGTRANAISQTGFEHLSAQGEARMARTLMRLEARLARWQRTLSEGVSGSASGPADVRSLRNRLDRLTRQVQRGFERTAKHITDFGLDPEVLIRHHSAQVAFEQRLAELRQSLEQLAESRDPVPSRGARHRIGDRWVPLDPSFKRYAYEPPLAQAALPGNGWLATLQGESLCDADQGTLDLLARAAIESTQSSLQTDWLNVLGDAPFDLGTLARTVPGYLIDLNAALYLDEALIAEAPALQMGASLIGELWAGRHMST